MGDGVKVPPVVNIAHCPEHGLHGSRERCFVCDQPVEQVPMVPASRLDAVRIAAVRAYCERQVAEPNVSSSDPVAQGVATGVVIGARLVASWVLRLLDGEATDGV